MSYQQYVKFDNKLLMIGFGSIGCAVLPLILRHIDIDPKKITIISKTNDSAEIAKNFGVNFKVDPITRENFQTILNAHLSAGDFLLNLSIDVESLALIYFCRRKEVLYLDTCIEPWAGVYVDSSLSAARRSNYALRESVLQLKNKGKNHATALVTHGANPGLVSHFLKQALMNMSEDNGLATTPPTTQSEWAKLARVLEIKTIHIAETDSQTSKTTKRQDEFVNTWSVSGFIAEGLQPAELGWGSHEKHWPIDAAAHDNGCQSAIFLNRPGASTRVRSWTPLAGSYHGFLITHSESIAIADYFSLVKDGVVYYRPTVHYAYRPCEDAVLSLHELAGREWQQQSHQRLLLDEIVEGIDELGVLVMGNKKGVYWYGSHLSIDEARDLVPYNNATSLQVAIGVLAGMLWVMENPRGGIKEPDDIDYQYIMNIARPYLGKVGGYYSDWTPIKERGKLFSENIDASDPWQFINMRVT